MGRAAGDAGIGKVGGAGPELDLLDVEPEAVGRDLGERGPGALAHVVRADLHHAGAVAAQHGARLAWNISAGKVAVPTPQPTSRPSSSRICRGASGRRCQPKRSAPCA